MVRSRQRILVVEDDPQLRNLYRATLAFAGVDVDYVGDGLDALRVIDANPPDLVVLDLNLPRLGGVFVQQEIAANNRTRHIPIVVVTGDPGELVEAENLCILRKPIDPEALVSIVRRCLRKSNRIGCPECRSTRTVQTARDNLKEKFYCPECGHVWEGDAPHK